jgi:hypothetical protein
MKRAGAVLAATIFALSFETPARADETPALLAQPAACSIANAAFANDDLSGFPSLCTVAPGRLAVETVYFQNASRAGGTALAAYPLVRLRTGVARGLEAYVDPPSQVAESGLHGLGLYPVTHIGYGVNYALHARDDAAGTLGIEVVPPASRFAVNEQQPKYIFTAGYGRQFGRYALAVSAQGSSSRTAGFGRIAPSAAVRLTGDAGSRTQISTDVGSRVVAHGAVAQTFADVSISERLRSNLGFALGIGTTFNGVENAKAHYLASGFNLHI